VLHQFMLSCPKLARPYHVNKIGWPGDPEPAWLRHRVEYERIAAELRAEERARKRAACKEPAPGFMARIRLARSRDR